MRILRGRIRLAREDAASAEADAARALAFARLTGHPFDVLPALAVRGPRRDRGGTGAGRRAPGETVEVEAAAEIYRRMGARPEEPEARMPAARHHGAKGRDRRARFPPPPSVA
jgi:hypothetical protein